MNPTYQTEHEAEINTNKRTDILGLQFASDVMHSSQIGMSQD